MGGLDPWAPFPATWLCPPGSSPTSDAQIFCLDGPESETGRFNLSSAFCEPAAHLGSALTNSNSKVNVSLIFQPRKCGAKKTIPAPASRIGWIERHVAQELAKILTYWQNMAYAGVEFQQIKSMQLHQVSLRHKWRKLWSNSAWMATVSHLFQVSSAPRFAGRR